MLGVGKYSEFIRGASFILFLAGDLDRHFVYCYNGLFKLGHSREKILGRDDVWVINTFVVGACPVSVIFCLDLRGNMLAAWADLGHPSCLP